MNNITNVTTTAIIKRRNEIVADKFLEVNDSLINYIYSDNKPRILTVDGTQITMSKSLSKYGYKDSKNKMCSVGFISGLFDIDKKLSIN